MWKFAVYNTRGVPIMSMQELEWTDMLRWLSEVTNSMLDVTASIKIERTD